MYERLKAFCTLGVCPDLLNVFPSGSSLLSGKMLDLCFFLSGKMLLLLNTQAVGGSASKHPTPMHVMPICVKIQANIEGA